MIQRSILFIYLIFYFLNCFADQLIIEPDMGRTPILNKINHTKESLELVMYGFTDKAFLDAFVKLKRAGKDIQIILEGTPYKFITENNGAIATLNQNQINWQGHLPAYHLIHQKTLIIDHEQALVMTFNFTNASFKKQRNFALFIDNPVLVHAIDETFIADWKHLPTPTHANDVIYSPDDSRPKLSNLLKQAKHSINIYAQSISDFKIMNLLVKAVKNGVTVNILTNNLSTKQARFLAQHGVKIRKSSGLYIHAKVIIIDNHEAVIGSINFTHASIDSNRELAVVSHDPTIIQSLNKVFAQDWQTAQRLM